MQNLKSIIQYPIGKNAADELASIEGISVQELIDLSFHTDDQIGFRAAWILERTYSNHYDKFLPFAISFLDQLPQQNNYSALRHYVKILAFMTDKKASSSIKEIITAYHTENLAEVVFGWLIDETIPVAIKSHCLNILANLIYKHEWIKEELKDTMEFLVDRESIAFFAKVKQIRKQLK